MRFEEHDAAERTLPDDLLDGGEIAGVAAILVHADKALLLVRDLHQILRFRERRREWLVDDDVTAGEQTLLRDRVMGGIRRGDDDKIDLALQHVVDALDEFDIGIARIRRSMALHDGREQQTFDRTDDGRVKDFPREAETDESDVEHATDCTSKIRCWSATEPVTHLDEQNVGGAVAEQLPAEVPSHVESRVVGDI